MTGIIRTAAILLLAGLALPAQTRAMDADPAQIRELLNSPRLTDQVWGVYYAGRLHDAGQQDLLVERLRRARPMANSAIFSPEFFYVAALFDSLIETGGAVPLDATLPFGPNWEADVLILLSRQQGTEDALFAIRDRPMHEIYWVAANNLLLGMRSARFLAKALAEVRITCTFEVRDGAIREPGSGTGGSAGSGAGPTLPADFPPVGLYYLEDHPSAEGAVLASGPRNVYYRRAVPPTGVRGTFHSPGDRNVYLLEYLAAWNHLDAASAQAVFTPRKIVQWTTAAALAREIETRIDAQVDDIRDFAARATQSGAKDLTGIRLRIVPILEDKRHGLPGALPGAAPREFILE